MASLQRSRKTLPQDPPSMTASPHDLFAFLDRLGIVHRTVSHPPLFTVAQSQALRGSIPGGHTKNLFLRDRKGALFLLSAAEEAEVELGSLHRQLPARGRFSFASAEVMRETLGVEPGAVTPFAAMNDRERRVRIVVDPSLLRLVELNFHPLVNTMTTTIASGDLIRFMEATHHPAHVLDPVPTPSTGSAVSS